ncbi:hypothetical protein H7I87_28485 [Mycobacterium timonense]|uniref:Uncharacterized protein n=1 Tax=Mycobacterium bouchedurhonense TaxID=701041 RepID=A0AAW5S1T3_MYCBC|nr:hypothetical protein [Mycobacterium bouchedurhonense]MCV6998580.1 hypothetical protein [Mycobacterium timonense]
MAAQYHVLEGTGREIPAGKDWVVQHGPAKEAFGQPGGGDQWIVLDRATNRPVPVEELIRRRLLRPDFYQASAHVGCGCLRGFRRGRVVAVQQRSGCACRLG